MRKLYFLFLLLHISILSSAQYNFMQYFDGKDTLVSNSILINLDTSSGNIWQIGAPQKILFDSAATVPNVLITDTIHNYPPHNISSFTFSIRTYMWNRGIMALRWKQKLDLNKDEDGAIIEYSTDSAKTWNNVFNSPVVYNFYGYDTSNVDTLYTGEYAFSGTDTTWRDIWLCFDVSYLHRFDSVIWRFTLKSDSVGNKEGWMIDNMLAHITIAHTVKNINQTEYLRIYPSPTTGLINIEAEKLKEFHVIEDMQLLNIEGKVVAQYGLRPTKTFIDISPYPSGVYYLKIKTNLRTETFPVILKK